MDIAFPMAIDSAGRLETVDGHEETAQRARMVLKSGQGEWDFDISYGVPWRQIMETRPIDLGAARAAIVKQLSKVPGLDSVTSVVLEADPVTRALSVVATVVASGVTVEISS